MKKLIIAITCLVSSFAYAQVAEWGEPIQIAVDSGRVKPNLCIDKLGNFHLVFQHEIHKYLHQDIYYKKSIDLGETWSTAKDISLNEHNLWYADPQICTDSENNIHVVFGEHKGDKAQRVLYTSCNTQGEWQQTIDTIAEKNPSDYEFPLCGRIAADAQNNIILTWGTQFPNVHTYYRIKDKSTNQWGDIHYPFNDDYGLESVVQQGDTLYYSGLSIHMSDIKKNRNIYTTYANNVWSEPIVIGNSTKIYSNCITLDMDDRPYVLHCQQIGDDSVSVSCTSIQSKATDKLCTLPRAYYVKYFSDIAFDQYNQAHVVLNETVGKGKHALMHYRKTSSGWIGEQLDLNYNHHAFGYINLQAYGEDIYLLYVDGEKIYDTWEEYILLRKYTPQPEGIAANAEVSALGTFKVYPNPVQGACHLDYQLANTAQVDIAIYDMQGRQVSTIYQGQQAAGAQQLSWDGGNLSPGVYIVRLQAGKYVVNRKITVK